MLISTAFTACIDESENLQPQQGIPLQLNVKTASIETRGLIESATLPDGEAHSIGLTLVNDGETTYDGKTYNNIMATPSTANGKQSWTMASDIYLSSTAGTLYGYYPYSSSVTDITQIPVTAGETDYMYATPVTNLDDGKYTASVTMNHALAAIRLNIVRGTYTGMGAVTAVSVKGDNIATSGQLNAKTGTLTAQVGTGNSITYNTPFTLSKTSKQIDQIIVPIVTESAAPTFIATIDGKDYTATPAAVTWAQGSIYEYTLTVNAKEVSLSDVNVGDWGYNSSGNPVINAGYNITLAGDIDGIAFCNTINDDGSVTIEAVPKAKNHFVSSVTSTGTASITNALDRTTGIRKITVNTIETDVIINFTSTYLHINADNVSNGVYAVTATGELIAYNDAAVDATCLGVALITDNQRIMIEKNGEANITSIKAAYTADGATNTGYKLFYWGNSNVDQSSIPNYNQVGGNSSSFTSGYLPRADGSYIVSYNNLSSDINTWVSGTSLGDYNGKANTAAIQAATDSDSYTTYANMGTWCTTFNATSAENQGYKDWYIPAAGQLALICLNWKDVNAVLEQIGGVTIGYNTYYSSSESSNYNAWFISFGNNNVNKDSKIMPRYVRFIRDINPTISFKINTTTFYAEDGMTWEEWYYSTYNTSSALQIVGDGDQIGHTDRLSVMYDNIDFTPVKISENIIQESNYFLDNGGTPV